MAEPVEVWLPVSDYEGTYEVSNLGRVRRSGGAVLKPCGEKYPLVSLSRHGDVQTHRLHRLVLVAFCGPEPFTGAHAAHNDGDTLNCALTNLRWATPAENQKDRQRHGTMARGEDVFGAVLTEDDVRRIRSRLPSERNRPIAEDFGVSISTIHLIRHNRIWRHVA